MKTTPRTAAPDSRKEETMNDNKLTILYERLSHEDGRENESLSIEHQKEYLEELSSPVIKCKKTPRKKCSFVSEEAKKDRLPIGRKRARKGSQKMKGAQWMDIRSDRQKGLSYVELGRKYHMDPRTAKRYAESPQKPEYTLSEPKPTKMDPYK